MEEVVMLVLSRKVGEQLVIGDNIRVVIHRVAGNRVTIGIEAPNDVRIIRGELQVHDQEFEAEHHDAAFSARYGRGLATATLPRSTR
jgi:carbon storage regulator